jgi:hypothetical protein
MHFVILIAATFFYPLLGHAQVEVGVGTDLPYSLGGTLGYRVHRDFRLRVGMGFMPQLHRGLLGDFIGQVAGLDDFGQISKESLKSANVFTAEVEYRPKKWQQWSLNLHLSSMGSSGIVTDLDTLEALGGSSWDSVRAAFSTLGVSPQVAMSLGIQFMGFVGKYRIPLKKPTLLDIRFGILKAISASPELNTQYAQIDDSSSGKALLNSTTERLSSQILRHGWVPILGIQYTFIF